MYLVSSSNSLFILLMYERKLDYTFSMVQFKTDSFGRCYRHDCGLYSEGIFLHIKDKINLKLLPVY